MSVNSLSKRPVHLGLGATAEVEPLFTGAMEWYMEYGARHGSDGAEGHTWEMHPKGCEVVLCTAGRLTLLQENTDATTNTVTLEPGDYVINEPGVWHTADVESETTAVFITAGEGTEIRPREPSS